MAQTTSNGKVSRSTPYWSRALRALRNARGITQEGWAAQLGYSRATIRRWELGQIAPSADAERQIITLCSQKRLLRKYDDGPLRGVHVTTEWIADLLAMARLQMESPTQHTENQTETFEIPAINYAANGNVSIAYQVIGNGTIDIVITPGTFSHREIDWENPRIREFILSLSRIARVIIYDKRGTGLSDRVSTGSTDDRINDLRAVMDATNCNNAILVGFTEGGPLVIKFAATWPERVSALVLYGSHSRMPSVQLESDSQSQEELQRSWGTTRSDFLRRFAPGTIWSKQEREWWARYQRMSASPGAVRDLNTMNASLDVRSLLKHVSAPSLIIHRRGDPITPFTGALELSREITDAHLVELDGDGHLAWFGDISEISRPILEFVAHISPAPQKRYELTTMAHIATKRADINRLKQYFANVGNHSDANWGDPSEWGMYLTFNSPTHAMRVLIASLNFAKKNSIEMRVGVHIGEIVVNGDGINCHLTETCRAIAINAPSGAMLVTRTVQDLTSEMHGELQKVSSIRTSLADTCVDVFKLKTNDSP